MPMAIKLHNAIILEQLHASNFGVTPCELLLFHTYRAVDIDVSVPLCEEYVHFTVNFSEGSQISECRNFRTEVPCTLEFRSTKSVSKTDFITIIEKNSAMRYVT